MKENLYTFSFILAYRHSHERFNNLKRVLDWVNSFNKVEVLLVEQDTHSKISHLNLKCKHIFTKTNQPFNKAWSFNVGLKHSTTNIVIFSDTDLIMDPNKFIEAIRELKDHDMVNPYNKVLDLTPQESQSPLNLLFEIKRPGRGETDIQKVPLCGGICIFKKDTIYRIGGWGEDFVGWGGEDDFQSIKVEKFLKHKTMDTNVYHLFHPRTAPDSTFYKKNLELLNRYKNLSKTEEGLGQLKLIMESSLPKIGAMNKYDNF